MIQIKDAAEPDYLSSSVVEASIIDIRDQVSKGVKSLTIPNHWGDTCVANTIKDVLFEIHAGKCCYCERKRTRKREMDVEHYRPKAKVEKETGHKGYWWLAYNWKNYLWSCKSCNQGYKKNQFPLLPTGVRAKKEGDNLELENPCLINPRFDKPCEYLAYHKKQYGGRWFVRVIASPELSGEKKQRAEETIEILGLNRNDPGDDLIGERGESLTPVFEQIVLGLRAAEIAVTLSADPAIVGQYRDIIIDFRKQLKNYVNPGKEYSGFFRYFLTDTGIDFSDLI